MPPEVPRNRVLFGERQIDHWQDRTFAGKDAAEKERDDGVVDIFAVEMAGDGGAELCQGPGEVGRLRRSGGLGRERACRDRGGAEKQRSSFQGEACQLPCGAFRGL